MKKIVITGGIGYIGTELCKIYSGDSWHNKITIIDNRFVSERVSQLRNWNMNFIHADIRDKDKVKRLGEVGHLRRQHFFFNFLKYNSEALERGC